MNRIVAAAALALTLAQGIGHAAAAEKQWVQGSWVNLRATAAADGAIVDRLVVNTEVALLSRQGAWCEVTAKTPEVRGFLACALLAAQAVSLADVGSPSLGRDEPNPRYSALRAFWLAPSMERLQAAGDHFWRVMLTPEQQAKENPRQFDQQGQRAPDADKRPPPLRYAIPEFEAMKELMKRGVVAAPERRPVLRRWADIQQAVAQHGANGPIALPGGRWVPEGVATLVRHARLNPVQPSFFQRAADLAPAASSVEELSAQFGIVERLKVLGGPKWVHPRHEDPIVRGNWDLGSFELSLDKPVLEYVVGRKGLAQMRESALSWRYDVTYDAVCEEGFTLKPRPAARAARLPPGQGPAGVAAGRQGGAVQAGAHLDRGTQAARAAERRVVALHLHHAVHARRGHRRRPGTGPGHLGGHAARRKRGRHAGRARGLRQHRRRVDFARRRLLGRVFLTMPSAGRHPTRPRIGQPLARRHANRASCRQTAPRPALRVPLPRAPTVAASR